MESALSFHGLIPEAVYTTTSVCLKRSEDDLFGIIAAFERLIPYYQSCRIDQLVKGIRKKLK